MTSWSPRPSQASGLGRSDLRTPLSKNDVPVALYKPSREPLALRNAGAARRPRRRRKSVRADEVLSFIRTALADEPQKDQIRGYARVTHSQIPKQVPLAKYESILRWDGSENAPWYLFMFYTDSPVQLSNKQRSHCEVSQNPLRRVALINLDVSRSGSAPWYDIGLIIGPFETRAEAEPGLQRWRFSHRGPLSRFSYGIALACKMKPFTKQPLRCIVVQRPLSLSRRGGSANSV